MVHRPSSKTKILQGKTALGIKAAAITFAIIAIFQQDLIIVAREALQSELCNHILEIPPLLGYIIYRKRKTLRAVIPLKPDNPKRKTILNEEAIGATMSVIAFLLYWHGSYTFHPLEYHLAPHDSG